MQRLTSKENPFLKELLKLKSRASYRKKNQSFVIEGVRLSLDALQSGACIEGLVCSDSALVKYPDAVERLSAKANRLYSVSNALFEYLSDTVTPQGILCVCRFCSNVNADFKPEKPITALALENIQDPLNMGTVLRTAEALGIEKVFISDDCVDVYSPKVLRGSMGAVFRLPICTVSNMPEFAKLCGKNGIATVATVPDPSATPVTSIHDFSNTVVFIGNEGNGLTEDLLQSVTVKATIPMCGRAESLNASAAAAIIMWEMKRTI